MASRLSVIDVSPDDTLQLLTGGSGQPADESSTQGLLRSIHALPTEGEKADRIARLDREQWLRLLDYEGWASDRLSPERMLMWLHLAGARSNEELARRFVDLEPEVQIALLQGRVRGLEGEELEQVVVPDGAILHTFPGAEAGYLIMPADRSVQEALAALIEVLAADDVEWTVRLLMTAGYSVVGEEEFLALQFRKARLEEDGFVSLGEAHRIFVPTPLARVRALFLEAFGAKVIQGDEPLQEGIVLSESAEWDGVRQIWSAADSRLREDLCRMFVALSNGVCSTQGVEPGDLRGQLEAARAVLGTLSLGFDAICSFGLDERELVATRLLLSQGRLVLRDVLGLGLGVSSEMRERVLRRLAQGRSEHRLQDMDCVLESLRAHRYEDARRRLEASWVETLGMARCALLLGWCERLPVRYSQSTREYISRVETLRRMSHEILSWESPFHSDGDATHGAGAIDL